jgi:hypothetical protein
MATKAVISRVARRRTVCLEKWQRENRLSERKKCGVEMDFPIECSFHCQFQQQFMNPSEC